MNFIDNGRVSLERGVFIGMWVGAWEKKKIELLHDRMGSPEMAHHRAAGPRAFVRTWGRIWGETWGPRLVCLVSPHAACPHASQFGSCDYIQPLGSKAHLKCVKEGEKEQEFFLSLLGLIQNTTKDASSPGWETRSLSLDFSTSFNPLLSSWGLGSRICR